MFFLWYDLLIKLDFDESFSQDFSRKISPESNKADRYLNIICRYGVGVIYGTNILY